MKGTQKAPKTYRICPDKARQPKPKWLV
jgi:hypothetical protein